MKSDKPYRICPRKGRRQRSKENNKKSGHNSYAYPKCKNIGKFTKMSDYVANERYRQKDTKWESEHSQKYNTIRSIRTCLTASPCFTTIILNVINSNRQKINAAATNMHVCRSLKNAFSSVSPSLCPSRLVLLFCNVCTFMLSVFSIMNFSVKGDTVGQSVIYYSITFNREVHNRKCREHKRDRDRDKDMPSSAKLRTGS